MTLAITLLSHVTKMLELRGLLIFSPLNIIQAHSVVYYCCLEFTEVIPTPNNGSQYSVLFIGSTSYNFTPRKFMVCASNIK